MDKPVDGAILGATAHPRHPLAGIHAQKLIT